MKGVLKLLGLCVLVVVLGLHMLKPQAAQRSADSEMLGAKPMKWSLPFQGFEVGSEVLMRVQVFNQPKEVIGDVLLTLSDGVSSSSVAVAPGEAGIHYELLAFRTQTGALSVAVEIPDPQVEVLVTPLMGSRSGWENLKGWSPALRELPAAGELTSLDLGRGYPLTSCAKEGDPFGFWVQGWEPGTYRFTLYGTNGSLITGTEVVVPPDEDRHFIWLPCTADVATLQLEVLQGGTGLHQLPMEGGKLSLPWVTWETPSSEDAGWVSAVTPERGTYHWYLSSQSPVDAMFVRGDASPWFYDSVAKAVATVSNGRLWLQVPQGASVSQAIIAWSRELGKPQAISLPADVMARADDGTVLGQFSANRGSYRTTNAVVQGRVGRLEWAQPEGVEGSTDQELVKPQQVWIQLNP